MEEKIQIINDDTINSKAIGQFIWAKRRFITKVTIVFTVVGVIYAIIATPYYKSTITLYPVISETAGAVGQLQRLATTYDIAIGGAETSFNIPDVVKSRRVRKAILGEIWTTEKYENPVNLITYWEINDTTGLSLDPLVWVRTLFTESDRKYEDLPKEWEEEALERLGELISVSEDRKTGLIRIVVLIEESQLAADIANYVAQAVTDYIQTENSFEASRDRMFIEERLAVMNEELAQAETDLKEFRQNNRRIADSPELQLEEERLIRQVEIKQQVYITLQQQLELTRIEEVKQTPVIHTLDIAEAAIEKDKPKRMRIVILSLIFGGISGMTIKLITHSFEEYP